MPSPATVRCCTSEPAASDQSPALPSAGIITLDHLAGSPAALTSPGMIAGDKVTSIKASIAAVMYITGCVLATWRILHR
ncbi:hypothetical protein ACFLV2_03845 [Chloroflexota bacterium]